VEEPAVCLDGTALVTQMRPASRAREVEPMRPVLESMGFSIVEMREYGAYLDGGDVLFTGREFLIGLTQRTNSVSQLDSPPPPFFAIYIKGIMDPPKGNSISPLAM
jgi:N-dimethylarginine dimethylaminohydrolase